MNFQELNYVKWGLAGSNARWQPKLLETARELAAFNPACLPVAVAYADWQLALAPTPDAILAFVRDYAWPVFLLDTWRKDGRTLLDWLSLEEIRRLCERCRRDGIQLALAGSLEAEWLEPRALGYRGMARIHLGDLGGLDDLEHRVAVPVGHGLERTIQPEVRLACGRIGPMAGKAILGEDGSHVPVVGGFRHHARLRGPAGGS